MYILLMLTFNVSIHIETYLSPVFNQIFNQIFLMKVKITLALKD